MGSASSCELMDRFADLTGLTDKAPPRRYLWTDAFAVCNFVGLFRETGNDRYFQLALTLVDQVHAVLGHHRPDDARSGWISGLSAEEGARHPTRGGLRIGKMLNERQPFERPDPRLEWEQDGQYFHYLTKWMHALDCVGRGTGERRFLEWAIELAIVAHQSFTYQTVPDGPKRMFWKMSIDLTRPLVESMGHHDPLDGLLTCLELRSSRGLSAENVEQLDAAIADFTQMCGHAHWATDDPLGIGGLLDDALRLAQMVLLRGAEHRELLAQLLRDAVSSLNAFSHSPLLGAAAEHRLAFRELGMSIGLHGLPWMAEHMPSDPVLADLVQALLAYEPLAERIESFWCEPARQRSRTWIEHGDINMVMLATSLAPAGYLML